MGVARSPFLIILLSENQCFAKTYLGSLLFSTQLVWVFFLVFLVFFLLFSKESCELGSASAWGFFLLFSLYSLERNRRGCSAHQVAGGKKENNKNTSSFLLGENHASQNIFSYLLFSTQACLGVFSCFLGFLHQIL